MNRWMSLLIAASLVAQSTQAPEAQAQDDELDQLFEGDTLNDPPPPFPDAGMPAPPPPPDSFDPPPVGAGFPPPDNSFPPGNMGGGSGNTGGGGGGGGKAGRPNVAPTSGDVKSRFSKAQIEDITNSNFPETIESFDFPNADIKDVIKAISELTGKNFIIDSGINGRVTIMAPSKITVAEAYKAFLSALAGLGYTVVPSGKFLKIKSARNAQRDSIETYSGPYFPDADLLITRIVQLTHTSAEEINKRLRILPSKDGEMTPYEPTNSLIITDYGANVERIMKIIREIDKPGFEETLEVIPIKYAKAKDLADLLNQIINKEPGSAGGAGGFRPGVPRFRSRVGPGGPGSGAPEELSLVAPDDRTNAIIVLGTKAGIQKVRNLVRKLDYRLDPSEAAGVFVYYVKYGEAEKIAATLQGVQQAAGSGGGGGGGSSSSGAAGGIGVPSATRPFTPEGARQGLFGGDVKIQHDKVTNSLVIAASRQDYEVVKELLKKIDIPRDQVYVESILMEMKNNKTRDWNPAVYYFQKLNKDGPEGNGIGRAGFSKAGTLANIFNPTGDVGAILSFGNPDENSRMRIRLGQGQEITIPNLIGFINFLQTNLEGNVLSTPQVLAMDNEESEIEVGDRVPIGQASTIAGTGVAATQPQFEDAPIKLNITPFISPDSEAVRLKLALTVKQVGQATTVGGQGGQQVPTFTTRGLKSNIVVNSGDTAVLGGLVKDNEEVTETKVPLLGDIPVLGWLFKSNKREKNKVNLLMFLTPRIIRDANDNLQNLTRKSNDRINWLKENFNGRDPYGAKMDEMIRSTASSTSDVIKDVVSEED